MKMRSFIKKRWIFGLVAFNLPGVLCDSTITSCPGYKASNVQKSIGQLTADLTLVGDACNMYGYDLKDLKLLVEYQSRKPRANQHSF